MVKPIPPMPMPAPMPIASVSWRWPDTGSWGTREAGSVAGSGGGAAARPDTCSVATVTGPPLGDPPPSAPGPPPIMASLPRL